MVLPTFGFPPTPNTHCTLFLPAHPPPIYFIPDIARVEKTVTKTSSVSCVTELRSYNTLAIQLSTYVCCKFGVHTVWHQRARVA